jgi:dTMP kinase
MRLRERQSEERRQMARVADAIRNGNKLFITFEGGDGAGKSTQAQMLSDRLCANGIDVLLTREPGGTKIGEEIREILLNPACTEMASHTEMFLYAAARAQLAREVIAPALAEGKTVICDRWVDSSLVYQGVARRLGEMVAEVNRYAVADLAPDLTILLDIDSDEGLARACAVAPRLPSVPEWESGCHPPATQDPTDPM